MLHSHPVGQPAGVEVKRSTKQMAVLRKLIEGTPRSRAAPRLRGNTEEARG
jgi:hypothetical protein